MSASLLQSSIQSTNTTRMLGGKRLINITSSPSVKFVPKAGNWLPGSIPPPYLPKELVGYLFFKKLINK